uniref:Uncharacterized protein n=1 Tax=Timema douglasi TaxID=61478 RepID=A0A7R8VK83_TIMDO|nr:unnamed protein product [Timema douglasi]
MSPKTKLMMYFRDLSSLSKSGHVSYISSPKFPTGFVSSRVRGNAYPYAFHFEIEESHNEILQLVGRDRSGFLPRLSAVLTLARTFGHDTIVHELLEKLTVHIATPSGWHPTLEPAASYNLFQIMKELSIIGSGSGWGMSVNSAEPDG